MYPIRFEPIYQDYIWGGDRIVKKYQRAAKSRHAKSCYAESWEISDRSEAMSVVANGPWKGRTFRDLLVEFGEIILGQGREFEQFPLLLKIIDAKENLSIQVHPDEKTAKRLKGEPKTEMWYALEPGSVYAGLKKEVEEKEFFEAIEENRAEELLEKIDLRAGDVVYIPGGRIHAICSGSLLYEIQQNSNTTYRLYDWGRKDKEGKKRELHLEEGAASIHWNDHKLPKIPHHHLESDGHHQIITLLSSPFFIVERVDAFDLVHIAPTAHSFQVFFCIKGEGVISANQHKEPFHPGMTYLIPAACGPTEIEGKCEALRIRLPEPVKIEG